MSPKRYGLDRGEEQTQRDLIGMYHLVEGAIAAAVDCLRRHDVELAREIVAGDAAINAFQHSIEQECIMAIATQQPVARDLRMLIADTHIAAELERIGDYATDIARTVMKSRLGPPSLGLERIDQMAELGRGMLERVMEAYEKQDTGLACAVAAEDEEVDRLEELFVDEVLGKICSAPGMKTQGTHLLWVGHNLERIADRATNIAERVVFMLTGERLELNP